MGLKCRQYMNCTLSSLSVAKRLHYPPPPTLPCYHTIHEGIPRAIIFFQYTNNIIIIWGDLLGRFMPNQYSITVSEDTDRILKEMKKKGYKLSQVIDAAIKSIQEPGLTRMVAMERRIKYLEESEK